MRSPTFRKNVADSWKYFSNDKRVHAQMYTMLLLSSPDCVELKNVLRSVSGERTFIVCDVCAAVVAEFEWGRRKFVHAAVKSFAVYFSHFHPPLALVLWGLMHFDYSLLPAGFRFMVPEQKGIGLEKKIIAGASWKHVKAWITPLCGSRRMFSEALMGKCDENF